MTGLVHKYNRLTINFSLPGKVVFSMFGYLEDIILEGLEDMRYKKKNVLTPAVQAIFKVNEDSEDFYGAASNLFHRFVERLLFALEQAV